MASEVSTDSTQALPSHRVIDFDRSGRRHPGPLAMIRTVLAVDADDRALGFVLPLVAVAGLAFWAFVMLSLPFAADDWTWLWYAQHPREYLADMQRMEMFRPIPHLTYSLAYHLFGVRPTPLAFIFLVVNLAGVLQLVRIARAVGFPPQAAVLGGLVGLFSPANLNGMELNLNEVPLALLFGATLVLAFLREDSPAAWRWVPLLLASLASHLVAIGFVPLLFLCLWTRDGVEGVTAALRRGSVRALLGVLVAFVLLRLARDWDLPRPTHALDWSGLVPSSGVLLAEAVALAAPAFALFVLLLLLKAHARVPSGAPGLSSPLVRRLPLFVLGWAVLLYGPHFLATMYQNPYFARLSMYGPALVVGLLLSMCLSATRVPTWLRRLRVLVVALVIGLNPAFLDSDHPELPGQLARAMRDVKPGPDGVTRVILVEDWPVARAGWLAGPSYLYLVGADEQRNRMFEVLAPGQRTITATLDRRHLPFLCTRPEDRVLLLKGAMIESGRGALEPIPGCEGGKEGIPRGLDDSRSPTHREGTLTAAFTTAARNYWRAYSRGDLVLADELGREAVEHARAEPAKGRAMHLAAEAIAATLPRRTTVPPGRVRLHSPINAERDPSRREAQEDADERSRWSDRG